MVRNLLVSSSGAWLFQSQKSTSSGLAHILITSHSPTFLTASPNHAPLTTSHQLEFLLSFHLPRSYAEKVLRPISCQTNQKRNVLFFLHIPLLKILLYQKHLYTINLYGNPSQLPEIGMSPGIPKPNTRSAKPFVLLLRRKNWALR